ncbi:hypothetical protein CBR_g34309 [Chara braunii]|uniref:SMP domain-containing protein n=1 Tax=Chara braunii TaxID=69332 RepID=A0A388JYS2_CHABU|nr:hypothetical protein CBR_g34309 [Chara braunii]|eukprot:GBG62938.1 hypothetical protein CBR_g34309 [Chara braunii]
MAQEKMSRPEEIAQSIGKQEGERQDIAGKPITKEDASHIQAEAMKAGEEVKPGSLAARAQSAASVNVREGRIPPGPGLGDVKPFDEEPYKSDLQQHGMEIGGKPGEKRDVAGKPITPEDASRIQQAETRLGHDTSKGSLSARAASAAAANVREGIVKPTPGGGTAGATPRDRRSTLEQRAPQSREELRQEIRRDRRQEQGQ